MLFVMLAFAVSVMPAQTPPPNVACSVFTPAQVTAPIGTAKMLPMSSAANGSSCMFQNNDKIITVLVATNASADAAQGLFNAKKRIVAGTDIAGWGVPAYVASMENVAVSGVLKQQRFVVVKLWDSAQMPT